MLIFSGNFILITSFKSYINIVLSKTLINFLTWVLFLKCVLIDLLMFVILTNNICSVCLLLLISLQIEFFADHIKVREERITNKIFLQISLPILLPTPNTYMQKTKINVQRLWGSTAILFSYTNWQHLNPNIHEGPMIYLNKVIECFNLQACIR